MRFSRRHGPQLRKSVGLARVTNENGLHGQAVVEALSASCAVAFLEFLVAAAWAWIVATHILQGVAHWVLVSVTAVRTMNVAVLVVMMIMVVMIMVVIVVAIWAMNMGLLVHRGTPLLNLQSIWRALSRKSKRSSKGAIFFALNGFF
ncbi:hypothetical protein ALP72_02955 [Pseudomonas coronafaciens pv. coronafaciens]|nr:hypothetical protein ALQ25_00089 [Pseudomonas coronafaciens pv. atropurpurea]RMS13441.1 hypothetical protein ALP72_02955 [Pseudomonas coronafaciens pv. coronafaciens]